VTRAVDADVVVAGGGPSGLGTAIHAALAGLSAIVVEPRAAPIDKACGEGLMPAGVRALERLGVTIAESRPFAGIRYVQGDARAEGRFRGGRGLGIRRTVLHAGLAARAEAVGVRTVAGRVEAVREGGDGVEAAVAGAGALRARWLVAADGLHSRLRRDLGLEVPARNPGRYGIRRHFRIAPWADLVEVHWAEDAEAYVTPVAADLVGVAVLFARETRGPARGGFDDVLARFPALVERLRGAPAVGADLGGGPFERRARRPGRGRVLLVGDAAGFLDPITGEGVRLGLAEARALVRCVAEGRPEDYEREWRRLWSRYSLVTSGLLRLARSPRLRPWIVPFLRRFPGLFDRALGALGG